MQLHLLAITHDIVSTIPQPSKKCHQVQTRECSRAHTPTPISTHTHTQSAKLPCWYSASNRITSLMLSLYQISFSCDALTHIIHWHQSAQPVFYRAPPPPHISYCSLLSSLLRPVYSQFNLCHPPLTPSFPCWCNSLVSNCFVTNTGPPSCST
jgi:hypothetical protein